MYTLIHLAVLTVTILVLAKVLPDVHVKSVGSAVIVAIVFSVLNFFLGWLLKVALVVPAILTLGILFLFIPFIVNVVMLWLTDKVLGSFEIQSLSNLLLSAGVITAVNGLLHYALRAHLMSYMHHVTAGPTRWI
jgi:putative membrane protein